MTCQAARAARELGGEAARETAAFGSLWFFYDS